MTEFDLIARITRRARRRADVVLGIGDDAAILAPPPGHELVVSTDTLVEGVHFLAAAKPADIGWKALAVNLSDLAAMGATPVAALLNLSLPRADADFVDGFMQGFEELAARHDVALVGGDTTMGPLAITITALGWVAQGRALRRDAARVGDAVYVTGTLGDAAAGLALAQDAARGASLDVESRAYLRARLDRPEPRVRAGLALRGVAHAAIDISDGLVADLAHVASASAVAIEIDAALLPLSPALRALIAHEGASDAALAGGDDYELAFTAAPDLALDHERVGIDVTPIGRVREGAGITLRNAEGITLARRGWDHFA